DIPTQRWRCNASIIYNFPEFRAQTRCGGTRPPDGWRRLTTQNPDVGGRTDGKGPRVADGVGSRRVTMSLSLPEPLDQLADDERATLSRYMEEVRFAEGACIFRMGATGDGCFIIDEGHVRLEVEFPELDTESVLGYLDPG